MAVLGLTTWVAMCKYQVMDDEAHDKWLDIDEAVACLRPRGVNITRKSLYSNVSRYRQPRSYKIRGRLRFNISDLDEWIASITKER
jgi:predicted DNA-binding transcriptional regulator AlpA